MVRTAAMIYLKNELLRTPPVPTEEELEAIKKERQERIRQRIAYERQLEEEQRQKERETQRESSRSYDRNDRKSPTPTTNQVFYRMTLLNRHPHFSPTNGKLISFSWYWISRKDGAQRYVPAVT